MAMVGAPLPRANEAIVTEAKLRGYVLNQDHPDGSHKARVIRSALGLTADDWEALRDQILEGITRHPVTEQRPAYNGTRCSVVLPIRARDGRTEQLMTGWRVPDDGAPPHLVTAYLLLGGRRETNGG